MMTSPRRSLLTFVAIAAMLVAGIALVACGGDDGGDIKAGSDEDYVLATCEARSQLFADVLIKLFSGDELTKEEQLDAIADPIKNFRTAIADAIPPADAADYQRELLAGIDDVLDAIDAGDMGALDSLEFGPDDTLSKSTRSRFAKIARDTAACEGLSSPFGSDG